MTEGSINLGLYICSKIAYDCVLQQMLVLCGRVCIWAASEWWGGKWRAAARLVPEWPSPLHTGACPGPRVGHSLSAPPCMDRSGVWLQADWQSCHRCHQCLPSCCEFLLVTVELCKHKQTPFTFLNQMQSHYSLEQPKLGEGIQISFSVFALNTANLNI